MPYAVRQGISSYAPIDLRSTNSAWPCIGGSSLQTLPRRASASVMPGRLPPPPAAFPAYSSLWAVRFQFLRIVQQHEFCICGSCTVCLPSLSCVILNNVFPPIADQMQWRRPPCRTAYTPQVTRQAPVPPYAPSCHASTVDDNHLPRKHNNHTRKRCAVLRPPNLSRPRTKRMSQDLRQQSWLPTCCIIRAGRVYHRHARSPCIIRFLHPPPNRLYTEDSSSCTTS